MSTGRVYDGHMRIFYLGIVFWVVALGAYLLGASWLWIAAAQLLTLAGIVIGAVQGSRQR